MTSTDLIGIRRPPATVAARAAALAALLAVAAVPAATAQESEEVPEERKVRVLVLNDGAVEVQRDPDDDEAFLLAIEEAANATEDARGLKDRLRSLPLLPPSFRMHFGGAYLGVEAVDLTEPLRAHFGVPEGSGVLISRVAEESPAQRAGVQVGDILTRVDGEDVTSHRRLTSIVRRAEDGDPANLEVWRDGKVETLGATLGARPRPRLEASTFILRGREDLDGDGEIDAFTSPADLHEKIQEYFHGDEWRERHETLQQLLQERRPDLEAVEERLAAVKRRLEELEARLDARGLAEEN